MNFPLATTRASLILSLGSMFLELWCWKRHEFCGCRRGGCEQVAMVGFFPKRLATLNLQSLSWMITINIHHHLDQELFQPSLHWKLGLIISPLQSLSLCIYMHDYIWLHAVKGFLHALIPPRETCSISLIELIWKDYSLVLHRFYQPSFWSWKLQIKERKKVTFFP